MARVLYFILSVFLIALVCNSVESQLKPPGMSIQQAESQLVGARPNDAECKPVGFHCKSSAECCSKKCPSYRSKCVS